MKQYRLSIYVLGGVELVGKWLEYDADEFANKCKIYADDDCAFTVEFRTIGE